MSMPPRQERPDQSVYEGTGSSYQISGSYGQLISSIQELHDVIQNQVSFMERQADASARYAATTSTALPQIDESALRRIAQAGGMSAGMTGQTSLMTTQGALSSFANLQQFSAQRIGAWMAGLPTVSAGPGQPGMFNPPTQQGGGGGTPAGTPSSAAAPAGSGAQAYSAQSAAAAQYIQAWRALGGQGTPPQYAAIGAGGGGTGGGRGPVGGAAPTGGIGQGPGSGISSAPPALQLLGSRIALSGGTLSGITSALREIPGVGIIADLFDKGTGFFQKQFEAGRMFQEQEGGTNLGGQAERLHQLAYQASMAFSPLGTSGAAEAFQGVTQLGYNRQSAGFQTTSGAGLGTPYQQDRQGALNFIYNQFTQTGATVQQSLQELEIASQNSTVSLGNLGEILKKLSDTAGQAGNNADSMRKSFMQAFQTALTGGAGPAAPGLAGAVTATQAGYGQAFATTSFAGELTQGRQYLLAGQYGITPGQAGYIQRNQPQQYLQMISGQNLNFIQQLPGMTAQSIADMQARIRQAGGASGLRNNPDLVNQIANDWLNRWQAQNDIIPSIWAQILSSLTGVPLTANNVVQFVVNQMAGNNEATQGTRMPLQSATGTRTGAGAVPAGNTRGAVTGRFGLAQGTFVPPAPNSLHTGLNMAGTTTTWQQVLTNASGPAAQAYLSEEAKTRKRSPVLEALLQNVGAGQQVTVQTKTGPRVMSFTDAMKYYPNELMSGTAMFYDQSGGKLLGSTSQITQGLVAPNEAGVSAEERSATGSNRGVSLKQYQRSHPGLSTTTQGGQTVLIDLSQEAKQLLKVLPSNSDQASAAGTVPAVPWPSQSSR